MKYKFILIVFDGGIKKIYKDLFMSVEEIRSYCKTLNVDDYIIELYL